MGYFFTSKERQEQREGRRMGRERKGEGQWKGRGRELPDQCQTASYAPAYPS